MTVYVDELRDYGTKGRWCHMMADTLEELHAMADTIDMKRSWFQNHPDHPHYDLMSRKRALAVLHGAKEVTAAELVEIVKAQREARKVQAITALNWADKLAERLEHINRVGVTSGESYKWTQALLRSYQEWRKSTEN